MAISERTKEVLDAIIDNPNKTAVDLAAIMGVSLGQVTGGVNSLKKAHMITVDDGGKILATAEAEFEYGDAPSSTATAATPASTSKKVAATALATDTSDKDDEELGAESATEATVTAEAATETVVAGTSEETTLVAATEDAGAEAAADAPATTSTLIPGTAPASAAATKTTKPAGESKAAKARAIWEQMKDRPRKEIMARLMTEVGLTQNGANTYLYNFRKGAGMVKARDAAPAATEAVAAETAAAATGDDAPAFVAESIDNVVVEIAPEAAPGEVTAEAATEETANAGE